MRSSSRSELAVARSGPGRQARGDPVPEPARFEGLSERLVKDCPGRRIQLVTEIGSGDETRELGQRVGSVVPLVHPALDAIQTPGLTLEDREVQIDGGIERLVGELLVPPDCLPEIPRGLARHHTVEKPLPRGRAGDRLVKIHGPADDQRERTLGLRHRLHA